MRHQQMCEATLLATNVHQQKAYWCVMIYLSHFPLVSTWPVVDDMARMVHNTRLGDKSSNDNPREFMNASCHDQHLGDFLVLHILVIKDY
jgi:hypothetical protein